MVCCRWESIQSGLLKSVITNILDHGFRISITNSPVELAGTPEMSFGVPSAEGGFLFEQLPSACSFQQVECLGDAHRGWNGNHGMNVIRHHTQLSDGDVMPFCNISQNLFAKVFILLSPKHVVPVLGTPLKVVQVLANAMATASKFQNFSRPGRVLKWHPPVLGAPTQDKKLFIWRKRNRDSSPY